MNEIYNDNNPKYETGNQKNSTKTGFRYEYEKINASNLTGGFISSETINEIIERNWHLEEKIRLIEKDYKEKYENLVKEHNEATRNHTKQIELLEKKINSLIKSKERWFKVPDSLIKEKVKAFLEKELEE